MVLDDPVTIKALSCTDKGEVLWVDMAPKSMVHIWQFIIEQGFADDRKFRTYVKRSCPKGVSCLKNAKGGTRYRVALPKSAITEATAIDSSKRPRKSVTCKSLTEAQQVIDNMPDKISVELGERIWALELIQYR